MLLGIGIGAVGMFVMFLIVGIINSLGKNDPDVEIIMAVQDNVISIFETEITSMKTDISEIDMRSLHNKGMIKRISCSHREVAFEEDPYTGFHNVSYRKKCAYCGKVLEQYPSEAEYFAARSDHMHIEANKLHGKSQDLKAEEADNAQ